MALIKFMVVVAVFMVAFAVAQANPYSSGGECPGGNKPNNVVSMLQTNLAMNALKEEGGEEMAVTFITVTDEFFETNLGASSLWKERDTLPHEWLVIKNDKRAGISKLYAQAQGMAQHPLLVFVHPDVMLPDDWYTNFRLKLAQLEAVDPDWGVLGTAGVPLDFTYDMGGRLKIASSITDSMSSPTRAHNSTAKPTPFTFTTGIDKLPVQALDEHLLVLRAGSPKFDPKLPGFDLYGIDIVLSARQDGLKSYLLNINVKHKTVDPEGKPFDPNKWWDKYNSAYYQKRADATKAYMLNKWRASSFLPVYGCGFDLLDFDLLDA